MSQLQYNPDSKNDPYFPTHVCTVSIYYFLCHTCVFASSPYPPSG